ncbi:MAG: hypothetical protein M1831_004078 [Alyxoria varia]|nr:MAG: hypothetical protein M1831_004078 [Alyxoria varia]
MALSTPAMVSSVAEVNLTSAIPKPRVYQPQVFKRAIQITEDMQHESTCHKQAVLSLGSSCNKIDVKGSEHNPDVNRLAESHEKLFGARLAVCEIAQAHVAIPKECNIMLPINSTENNHSWKRFWSPQPNTKPDWTYQPVSEVETVHCITALHRVVQFWTSYSNAKQSAVSLCQASRSDNQRGEYQALSVAEAAAKEHYTKHSVEVILDIHRKLSESLSRMPSALEKVLDQVYEQSTGYIKFYNAMHQLKANYEKDIEASAEKTMGFFAKLSTQILEMHHKTEDANEGARNLHGVVNASHDIAKSNLDKVTELRNALISIGAEQVEPLASEVLQVLGNLELAVAQIAAIQGNAAQAHDAQQKQLHMQAKMAEAVQTFKGNLSTAYAQALGALGDLQEEISGTKPGQTKGFVTTPAGAFVVFVVVYAARKEWRNGGIAWSDVLCSAFATLALAAGDHLRPLLSSLRSLVHFVLDHFSQEPHPYQDLKTIGVSAAEIGLGHAAMATLAILAIGLTIFAVFKRHTFGGLLGRRPFVGHQMEKGVMTH